MQGLSSDFKQFFLVRNNFVYFKERIWLPNGMEKINSYFDQEEMLKMA